MSILTPYEALNDADVVMWVVKNVAGSEPPSPQRKRRAIYEIDTMVRRIMHVRREPWAPAVNAALAEAVDILETARVEVSGWPLQSSRRLRMQQTLATLCARMEALFANSTSGERA